MMILTASRAVFTVFRPRVFFSESAEEDSADSINKARRRTDGYTTWDGMPVKHPGVGGGRRRCSGDRLPGTHVVNVQDRSVAGDDPNVRTWHKHKQPHDK